MEASISRTWEKLRGLTLFHLVPFTFMAGIAVYLRPMCPSCSPKLPSRNLTFDTRPSAAKEVDVPVQLRFTEFRQIKTDSSFPRVVNSHELSPGVGAVVFVPRAVIVPTGKDDNVESTHGSDCVATIENLSRATHKSEIRIEPARLRSASIS